MAEALMDFDTIARVIVALLAVIGAFVSLRRRWRKPTVSRDEPAPAPAARNRSVQGGANLDEPAVDDPVLGTITGAELLHAIAESNAPPPPPEGPLPAAIDAARRNAIVLRTERPQGPGKDGLSFFGGQPIGPEGFEWPRRHGNEGQPLTFMMQWDCEALAAQDKHGLLPADGVLYCFMDLEWGNGDREARIEAFLHHPGPTEGWAEIPLPADAPPIFGDQGVFEAGCTDTIDNARDYVPRMMPRFPFQPFALDCSAAVDALPEDERLFYGNTGGNEQLLAIANHGAPAEPLREGPAPHRPFARPFPAYPHDFAAVRHLAATMIGDLGRRVGESLKRHHPDMSDEVCDAQVAVWMDEAKEVFLLGCQRPMSDPLDQSVADDIWQWLEARKDHHIGLLVDMHQHAVGAVRLSLGVGSRALDRVPQEFINQAMRAYTLAFESMETENHDPLKHGTWQEYTALRDAGGLPTVRYVRAKTPARLLGPPSWVQGDVEELIDEYVLLLELPSHSVPGFSLGDGVVQYLIRPDDLAARRFDRVVSVASSY